MSFLAFLPYFWRFWRQKHPTTITTTRIFVPNFLAPIGIFYEFIDEGTKKQISNFNLFTNLINYKQKTWKMILKVETVTIKNNVFWMFIKLFVVSFIFYWKNLTKKYWILNVIILCHVSCILLKILNFCKNFCCPKILIIIIFGQNSSQNLLKLPLSLRFFVTTSFVAIRHHQKKTSIIIIIEHYFLR